MARDCRLRRRRNGDRGELGAHGVGLERLRGGRAECMLSQTVPTAGARSDEGRVCRVVRHRLASKRAAGGTGGASRLEMPRLSANPRSAGPMQRERRERIVTGHRSQGTGTRPGAVRSSDWVLLPYKSPQTSRAHASGSRARSVAVRSGSWGWARSPVERTRRLSTAPAGRQRPCPRRAGRHVLLSSPSPAPILHLAPLFAPLHMRSSWALCGTRSRRVCTAHWARLTCPGAPRPPPWRRRLGTVLGSRRPRPLGETRHAAGTSTTRQAMAEAPTAIYSPTLTPDTRPPRESPLRPPSGRQGRDRAVIAASSR